MQKALRAEMNKSYIILQIAWLVFGSLVLAAVLLGYDGKPNSDIEELLIWLMTILSFPIGFLVAAFFSLSYAILSSCCAITVRVSYLLLTTEWLMFLAAGYLQWFIFLPWLLRRWRASRIVR